MTIIYTAKADAEIAEIYRYIAHTLGEPQTAKNVVNRIMARVEELETLPELYRKLEGTRLRYFPVGKYYVLYRYEETDETVYVERVIHSLRNIDELI